MRHFDFLFPLFAILMILAMGFSKAHSKGINDDYINDLVNRLAKPYGLEHSVRTLIRLESNDGRYLVNLSDPACGITQISINTYVRRHKIENTSFNRNKACQDLMNSPELAISNAVEELLFWKTQLCNRRTLKCTHAQYQNVIRAYNAGWNYHSKKAQVYWETFKRHYDDLFAK